MDENPYQAPAFDAPQVNRKRLSIGRCIAFVLILPCLGMAGFSILFLVLAMFQPSFGQRPEDGIIALWHGANALAWITVIFGVVRNSSRTVIAALLAALVLVVVAVMAG